jgi:ABC-type uncharacterized transport system fused permease/ATPase subunit
VSEVLEKVKELHDNEGMDKDFVLRGDEEKASKEEAKEIEAQPGATDEWIEEWKNRGEKLRSDGLLRPSRSTAHLLPAVSRAESKEESKKSHFGTVLEGDIIKLQNVDIVSPDGRLLVRNLNLEVPPGTNIMITGPNGCGKSSLFRVLGELWPPYKGVVTKPQKQDLVFVPQKPYLVMGTLRDQIIYPHSRTEMNERGISDDDLSNLLSIVDPARSILSSWTYDQELDWQIAFSGGQKQRIAMARVFYHRPAYAVLDECTSAVSSEVEGKIYLTCRKLGVTLFTVSHRENLQQYHEYQLRLDGHGGWKFLTREEAIKNPRKA